MTYELRQGLSFCVVDGQFVFLDQTHNRYVALSGVLAATFAELLAATADARTPAGDLQPLVDRGLLVAGATAIGACQARRPSRSHAAPSSEISLKLVSCAAVATAKAMLDVRSHAPLRAFDSVRKHRAPPATTVLAPDRAELDKVVGAFRTLGLVVSPTDRCLPLSIAMVRMLCSRGFAPDLVIGVALDPFRAHCWVQIGDLVVNDTLDQVSAFTPILVL